MAFIYLLLRAQRLEQPKLLIWCGVFLGIAIGFTVQKRK